MLILIGLLLALSAFIVMSGFEIGKVEVLSYKEYKIKITIR